MSSKQDHFADADKKVRSTLQYISKSIPLQSLLYDLDMLPEVLMTLKKQDQKEWANMLIIAAHWRARTDELQKLAEEIDTIKMPMIDANTIGTVEHQEGWDDGIRAALCVVQKAIEKGK